MIRSVSLKYASRSLFRHTRRTILSMVGVGIGCGIALFAASWMGGAMEMQIRAASESGAGHLRIVPAGWMETREDTLRLQDAAGLLKTLESIPEVKVAAPRARTNGLLAFGNRTSGVQIVGVMPRAESASNRIVYKAQLQGRYLKEEDRGKVVIGRTLARRLDVDVDDDLFVTLVGRDEIKSAMFQIIGILTTGSRDLDSTICHVTLGDLESLSGYPGAADISLMIGDYRDIDRMREVIAGRMPAGVEVITWQDVNPGLAGNMEGDRAFTKGLVGIIIVVVSLGIASAQLTAVLERRTEFAILSALGMKARQIVALMVVEAIVIGIGGALVGLVLGGSGAFFLHRWGIDLAGLMGEDVSVGNVLLEPHVYGGFGAWVLWQALAISVVSTVVASVYPAWLAARVDPADALRMI